MQTRGRITRKALTRRQGRLAVENIFGRGQANAKTTTNPQTAALALFKLRQRTGEPITLEQAQRIIRTAEGRMIPLDEKGRDFLIYNPTRNPFVETHEKSHVAYRRNRKKANKPVSNLVEEILAYTQELQEARKTNPQAYKKTVRGIMDVTREIKELRRQRLTPDYQLSKGLLGSAIALKIASLPQPQQQTAIQDLIEQRLNTLSEAEKWIRRISKKKN